MGVFRRSRAEAPALTGGASSRKSRLRTTTASVQPLDPNDRAEMSRLQKRRGGTWQAESYTYYDAIGELKYAFNLVAFAVSRVRLFVAVEGEAGQAPSPVGDVQDLTPGLADAGARALLRLDHGIGIAELLRRTALNFQVTGECYLVRKPRLLGTGSEERWSVHSISEIDFKEVQDARGQKVTQYGLRRSRNASAQDVDWLPLGTFVCRMWRSHPEFEYEADSSMLGVLELCDELLLQNKAIRGITRSRLNAGLLYIPDEIALSRETLDDDTEELDAEEFENELMLALSQPVSDESAASSIVPLLIRGPKDLADAIKHITLARELQPELVARADRVLERIMQGVDLPKDVVSGLASVKYCLSEDTEIMTRDGWKTYDQVQVGDEVLTLNQETQQSEWQPAQAINVFDCVDEPMLAIEQRGHSSLSTLNHRWVARRQTSREGAAVYDQRVVTSAELATQNNLSIPVAVRHSDESRELKYTDAFVELVAWWTTEGCLRAPEAVYDDCVDRAAWRALITERRSALGLARHELATLMGHTASDNNGLAGCINHLERNGGGTLEVRKRLAAALRLPVDALNEHFTARYARACGFITQSRRVNPENCDRIRAALTALCGPALSTSRDNVRRPGAWWTEGKPSKTTDCINFFLSDELVRALQTVCVGKGKVTKTSFVQDLTYSQRELFIQTAIEADGYTRATDDQTISQLVPARLDAIELACILNGVGVHRYTEPRAHLNKNDVEVLKLKKRVWVTPQRDRRSIVEYTGAVWCPTTANGTWLARRNGTVFYTANSNALQIDKSLYTAHVEPLIQLIVQQYTEAYLRPALLSYGFTPQQARRLVVWYDASEILTDTQSVESSNDGLDRFAISLASWRRENGYSDHDAPDANELVLRLLIQRGQLDDPLTQSLFKLIAPRLMDATRTSDQESTAGPIPPDVQQMLEGVDPTAAPAEGGDTETAAPTGTPGPRPANVVSTPEAPAVL